MLLRNLSLCALLAAVALLISADSCNNFSVSANAANTSVGVGTTTTLTATSSNASGPVTYTWSLAQTGTLNCSTNCGSLSAATGTPVTYTAPANVPNTGKVVVSLSAKDTGGDSDSTTVVLTITGTVSVSVTPASLSFSPGGASQTFNASVVNDPTNKGVTWSLSLAGADCTAVTAPCGTLSSPTSTTVIYNPPTSAPAAEQVALTATPVYDTNITASAILSISAGSSTPLTIVVSPSKQTATPGETGVTFSASVNGPGSSQGVTWSLSQGGTACATGASSPCGTLSSSTTPNSVTYTAPATAPSNPSVTITATGVANTSVTATGTINILTLTGISLAPANASIQVGQTQPYTATGTYSDSSTAPLTTGVTWASSSTGVATISTGGVATGVNTGTTTISATIGSIVGQATLQVTGATQGVVPRYLFEVNSDNTLSSYAVVASTGQLRSVTHFVAPPAGIESAAINPVLGAIYLFQPNNTTGGNATVTTFAVSTGGQITEAGSNFFGDLDGLAGTIAVDPLGRYLFGTDGTDGQITLYTLDPTTGLPTLGTPTPVSPNGKQLAADATGSFLYIEDVNYNLLGYQIGANGTLKSVGTAPTQHPTNGGGPIAVDPQGVYLVAIDNASQPQLYAYQISAGTLTFAYSAPIGTAGGGIGQIAIDPTGTYLYAIDVDNNQLLGYINNGGVFTAIAGSPFAGPQGGRPQQLSVDPSGKYVYVQYQGTQEVWAYDIASGGSAPGALTLASKMRTRTSASSSQLISGGTKAVSFTPEYLYVANSGSNNIGQFSIAASSGALTSLGTPVAAGTSPYDVVADSNPSLPFVYSANQISNNISGYQVGANGALTVLPDSPYGTAGSSPEWVALDCTGGLLVNVNSASASLSGFVINTNSGTVFGDPVNTLLGGTTGANPVHVSIDPNGIFAFTVSSPASAANGTVENFLLTGAAGTPTSVAAGNTPDVGAVHPSGEYFYAANGDNTISEYSVNASTGLLTSIGTVTVAAAGATSYNAIAIEPSGNYLYFTEQTANLIYVFSINPLTGALTSAGSTPLATGTAPYGITVDISGSYVYVSNLTSNDIIIYSINPANGSLTQVGTTTVSAGGTSPRGMTTVGILQ